MSTSALSRLFHLCRSPAFFEALAPDLPVAATTDFSAVLAGAGALASLPLGLDGHATIPGLITSNTAISMCAAIEALHAEDLPAIFAYVFDASWEPLRGLQECASRELGPYDVLADIWAFRIAPGARGWSPHRGFSEFEGGRTMLNVWVALTDADATTSCMSVVPLSRDPAYPHQLGSVEAADADVLALVTPAGTGAVWDANTLHWGGPMRADAKRPRMSLTYTLRQRAKRRSDLPVLDINDLTFERRLDLIAQEILKYEHKQRSNDGVREWAKLRNLTRRVGAAL